MSPQELLTRTFVDLADNLVDDFDVVDLLTLLTDRCVEAFDVTDAGLVLAAPVGAELQVMASSSRTMRDLEIYELQSHEGPCLDCYRTGEPLENVVLANALDRWPRFGPVAIAAGFESVSAQPMRLRGTSIGALNLFCAPGASLSQDDLAGARGFADVATIAILQHQASVDAQVLNNQLQQALTSRVVIEQAKGMLAERADLSIDEAFGVLRRYARAHNIKLHELARSFLDGKVATSTLSGRPTPGP